jgi:hypothetical protein
MIDSIDRYYRYWSFDYSIKIKIVIRRSWAFVHRHGKKHKNKANFFNNLINWSILSIQCADGLMAIGQRKVFMIDCWYYRLKINKSLTDGLITSMQMRPKVSIDTSGINPWSIAIVPIYEENQLRQGRTKIPGCCRGRPKYQADTGKDQNTRPLQGINSVLGCYRERPGYQAAVRREWNTRLLQGGTRNPAYFREGPEYQTVIGRD